MSSGLERLLVIGNGRVGGAVLRAAHAAGLPAAVAGHGHAREAAAGAPVVLLCVPDRALGDVCSEAASASPPPAFLGHTSGASGLEALAAAGARGIATFTLHPLQTIPGPNAELAGAACAVSGATAAALALATQLGRRLGMLPFEVPEEHRAAYHAAAVIASNFLVALEETAAELLARSGVAAPRQVLAPLVLRTAANWAEQGGRVLTGPIARGDHDTVERHRAAVRALAPELLPLYDVLAERTRRLAEDSGR